MPVKQSLIIRVKYPDGKGGLTGVRAGKLIAQGSHGACSFLCEHLKRPWWKFWHRLSTPELLWLNGSFKKVCLQVNSEDQLLDIYNKAKSIGLKAYLIQDSGLTEFSGIKTYTCVSIGPDYSEKIDSVTKDLKLY